MSTTWDNASITLFRISSSCARRKAHSWNNVNAVGQSRRVFNARHSARIPDSRYIMQVTHHYQHYQHGHQHIAIRGVSTLVPPCGKKARRALGLVPSRIVDASLLRAFLRPRRRRQRRDPLPPVVSTVLSSLLSPTSRTALPFLSFSILPFRSRSLSAVLGTPRDLLAIRLIGKRGRPSGLQNGDFRRQRECATARERKREKQRDRTVHRTESLANEPESPAAKVPIAFLGVATFFNYGATLYLPRVPAWSISEIDSPLRVEHVRD